MPNAHIKTLLDDYLDTPTHLVPHAVLVHGDWGSGKTHYLKNIYEPSRRSALKAAGKQHTDFLFVSLHGVTSAYEAEQRIYRKAAPSEAVGGAIADVILTGASEVFRFEKAATKALKMAGNAAMRRLNSFVFVLDDIERVEPSAIPQIIGLVSNYVHNQGRHVILVANETILNNNAEKGASTTGSWAGSAEKIVGRRAKVAPNFESLVRTVIEKLKSGFARDALAKVEERIVQVAHASNENNLRNLSWSILNAWTVLDALSDEDYIPSTEIAEIALITIASTLSIRNRSITASQLKALPNLFLDQVISRRSSEKSSKSIKARASFVERFKTLKLDPPKIDYQQIIHLEQHAVIDKPKLLGWMRSTFNVSEPSWKKIWYAHQRPMTETEQAIAELRRELNERQWVDAGVILQIIGLALRFANGDGSSPITDGQNVEQYFKAYIDELHLADRLRNGLNAPSPSKMRDHEQLGFQNGTDEAFERLAQRLTEKLNASYEAEQLNLLEQMFQRTESGDINALEVLWRSHPSTAYASSRLQSFDPDRIARIFLKDMNFLDAGAKALSYRYNGMREMDPIFEELDWARSVFNAVKAGLEKWPSHFQSIARDTFDGQIIHNERERPHKVSYYPKRLKILRQRNAKIPPQRYLQCHRYVAGMEDQLDNRYSMPLHMLSTLMTT